MHRLQESKFQHFQIHGGHEKGWGNLLQGAQNHGFQQIQHCPRTQSVLQPQPGLSVALSMRRVLPPMGRLIRQLPLVTSAISNPCVHPGSGLQDSFHIQVLRSSGRLRHSNRDTKRSLQFHSLCHRMRGNRFSNCRGMFEHRRSFFCSTHQLLRQNLVA